MDIDDLKTLIELMNENALSELEIEEEGRKVRLVKEAARKAEVVAVPTRIGEVVSESRSGEVPSGAPAQEPGIGEITAPMVGTFYRSQSPDSDPFIEEGMKVTAETTVCIIEAMKVMNEIHAELSGTIVEALVENGQPVEYGQPLFKVKLEE